MGRRRSAVAGTLALAFLATPAAAQKTSVPLPVLAPLTGYVAIEGASQKNGASLAERLIRDVQIEARMLDAQTSPEGAVATWERAVRRPSPPVSRRAAARHPDAGVDAAGAERRRAAAHTLSGTARLSEMGNPYFFVSCPATLRRRGACVVMSWRSSAPSARP